jgi:hypothetical protein
MEKFPYYKTFDGKRFEFQTIGNKKDCSELIKRNRGFTPNYRYRLVSANSISGKRKLFGANTHYQYVSGTYAVYHYLVPNNQKYQCDFKKTFSSKYKAQGYIKEKKFRQKGYKTLIKYDANKKEYIVWYRMK